YLVTQEGRIVAAPTGPGSARRRRSGQLPEVSKSGDAVLRAVSSRVASARAERFRVNGGREPAIVELFPFQVSPALQWEVVVAIPESAILGLVRQNNDITLVICAIVLLLAVGAGALLAVQIARPLHAFAREMEQVGALDIPGAPSTPSPIAEVDAMGRVLDRMKASLGSFEKYVPSDLVRLLLESGTEARLGGQIVPLTVLFADVIGFTAKAEQMSSDALVDALSIYLDELEEIVTENGGIVDKYVGDAVFAHWGAPIRPAAAPQRQACEAALEYMARVRTNSAASNQEGGPVLRERFEGSIGIHCGEALLGNIGSSRRMDYTAIGDAVNLASRIEGLTKIYGVRILVSGAVHAVVESLFDMRLVDHVIVVGRKDVVAVYELQGPAGSRSEDQELAMTAYSEGLEYYRKREFRVAHKRFQRVLDLLGEDGPSRVLLERSGHYLKVPPDNDWNGAYSATSK
ncbi:MAG TPA: adenylate/guanylate cyclase domain-containing protein, partial [Chthonomonadales bacterium]|nr:adenylate/guanylate cyclase domain-containing protein [Chthonomonadales bacterium]